jgi:hypothetical protein
VSDEGKLKSAFETGIILFLCNFLIVPFTTTIKAMRSTSTLKANANTMAVLRRRVSMEKEKKELFQFVSGLVGSRKIFGAQS